MKFHSFVAGVALAIAGILSQSPGAHATTITGSQGVSITGGVMASSGNINTSSSFTLFGMDAFTGVHNQQGDFATYVTSPAFFGDVTLTVSPAPGSFSFSDAGFGSFTSTLIVLAPSGPTTQAYNVFGTFTPGTDFAPGGFVAGPAEFVISFTQAAPMGVISASATLYSPPIGPPIVPEPASLVMGSISIVMCGLFYGFRRRSGKAIA